MLTRNTISGQQDFIDALNDNNIIIINDISELTPRAFYTNSQVFEYIRNFEVGEKLAQGGMGEIYTLKNHEKFVIKVTPICKYRQLGEQEHEAIKELCDYATTGDLIFKLPGGRKNTFTYFMPNYFSELLIGMYMTELVKQNYTPNFPIIIGGLYNEEDDIKPYCIVMEKMSSIFDKITDKATLYYTLFGVFYGLYVAQQVTKFTHFDLHMDNIMARPIDPAEIHSYYLYDGTRVYIKNFNFIPIIMDFGFSRMSIIQQPNITYDIVPRYSQINRQVGEAGGVMNYGFFNKFIDGLSLYGSLSTYKRKGPVRVRPAVNTFRKKFANPNLWDEDVDRTVLGILTGIPKENTSKLLTVKTELFSWHQGTWRPKPDVINKAKYNFTDPLIAARKFLNLAFKEKNNTAKIPYISSYQDIFLQELNRYNIVLSDTNETINDIIYYQDNPQNYKFEETLTQRGIMKHYYNNWLHIQQLPEQFLRQIESLNDLIRPYNRELTPLQLSMCNSANQKVTVAFIDPIKAYDEGYKFRNDCCRLDIFDYMSKYESGVAINSTYFDFKGTNRSYKPIGKFKTGNELETYYDVEHMPVPQVYEHIDGIRAFPAVVVSPRGEVKIIPYTDDLESKSDVVSLFRAGPLIVDDGKVVFNEDKFKTKISQPAKTNNEYYPYQCVRGKNFDEPVLQDRYAVNNNNGQCINYAWPSTEFARGCDSVEPGEPIHGSNPNPRTALCIRSDKAASDGKGKLAFVYVEGRGSRGYGMDFRQLGDICVAIGAQYAINLDGGTSSALVWKIPDDNVLYTSNPENIKTYAIASIFSLVK